jgi:hypothetical protein
MRATALAVGRSDRSWCFSVTGFVAGATIGANFQTDAFVAGAEADFDRSLMDGKMSSPFCSTGMQRETKTRWFSTLRSAGAPPHGFCGHSGMHALAKPVRSYYVRPSI